MEYHPSAELHLILPSMMSLALDYGSFLKQVVWLLPQSAASRDGGIGTVGHVIASGTLRGT